MAVTTSQVTTSANGDLALNPNGTGGVKFTKLATAAMPVGVKADGTVQHFKISELVSGGSLTSTDTIMVQKTGETTTKKSALAEVLAGAGGIGLSSLSVTTGTASNGGVLSYNNTNGVFTFKPASLSDLGGLTLTSLSVTTGAAANGGSLSYNNAGVFTFKPASLSGLGGIGLGNLSVTQATASGTGTLTYNNASGVFTYTPPDLSGLGGGSTYTGTNGIGFKAGTSTQFEVKITTLTTR